ncbi:hypothetical protein G6M02_14110 [Agrobacterium rhizogenes]|nr:hypothetical protein [Rhizobium rhizogenes]
MDNVGINVVSGNGIDIFVPIDFRSMSEAEKTAFLKLASSRDKSSLSDAELSLLKARKTYATGDAAPEGLICRWDWTCWAV